MQLNEREIRRKYESLTRLLIARQMTITTMESATAGQLVSLITDTEGASAICKGALVTYSNEAKVRYGVPKEVIDEYSVYSRETASAMARASAMAYQADIGIGVTGTMGNVDPANVMASVPGKVYYAFDIKGKSIAYEAQLACCDSRYEYKLAVAEQVVDQLLTLLEHKESEYEE